MNKIYQKSFLGGKNTGFTLIELLVVVLIIGILAAVAVPQYERAVLKSKMLSLAPLVKSIRDANELYYMANGTYTDSLYNLDITLPAGATGSNLAAGLIFFDNGTYIDQFAGTDCPSGECYVYGGVVGQQGHNETKCVIKMYFQHSTQPGKIRCSGQHPQCDSICASLKF